MNYKLSRSEFFKKRAILTSPHIFLAGFKGQRHWQRSGFGRIRKRKWEVGFQRRRRSSPRPATREKARTSEEEAAARTEVQRFVQISVNVKIKSRQHSP